MYREFVFLVKAYFSILKLKECIYEIALPLIVAAVLVFCFNVRLSREWMSSIVNLMAIILGFTVATITILLTSKDSNLERSKETLTKKKVLGKDITLFRELIIVFFYIAFVSMTELLISLITQFLRIENNSIASLINIFLILHLVFVSIRNLTNLFFIEFK